MCEYCGCQALTTIDELTREHDEVVRLIGHLRTAHQKGSAARMAETAREIARVLDPHTQVEEHGLFPALAADFPDQIAALEAEHRQVETVLAEAADGVTPSDPTWPDRLMNAMDMLRDHILKEAGRRLPGRTGQPQHRGMGSGRGHPRQGGQHPVPAGGLMPRRALAGQPP
ncbi:hemerythrin domain-containing protein [Streptomyces sparsogenes]|uniref:hemerythrin domain-containing protein n=1 Tax=Streptomyces sparsogenes TaxID=67365 RepID=UPI0033D2BF50